jgi:hypothetical protein
MQSLPLRRLPDNGQPHHPRWIPAIGSRCLPSVSHALKAFIRPLSAGPVSCRSRPWGFPFRVDNAPGAIHSFECLSPPVVGLPPGHCFRCFDLRPLGSWSVASRTPFYKAALRSAHPTSGFCSPRASVLSVLIMPERTRPSWAFSSLGASPLPPAGFPRSPILSWAWQPSALSTAALQSISRGKVGWTL